MKFDARGSAKAIIAAFRAGGVPLAAAEYAPHSAFRSALIVELKGKLPAIFVERICFKPKRV